jgi:two-component sensor histidine kinase
MNQESSVTAEQKGQGRVRQWLVRHPRAAPWGIFAAVLAITLLSVVAIEINERQNERARMSEYAQVVASSLDRRGNAASAYLTAAAALLASPEEIDPAILRQFVNEVRLDSDYRGAQGIGWAEALEPDQVQGFLSREQGRIERVWPEPPGDAGLIVPVTYLLPGIASNRASLGFDLYSDPVRRAAMDQAKQAVRPTATGKANLVRTDGNEVPGFVIIMPVYERVQGARPLKGFVYSPFNAAEFLDGAIERAPESTMGVRLYDDSVAPENILAARAAYQASGNTLSQPVLIANHRLVLQIESSLPIGLAPISVLTLVFGLAVASLLMVLARMLTQQAIEDQARIEFYEEQNSIRNSLTRELNHRVKNTLANVLSIMSLTRRRTDSLDEYANGLEGRVRSLSATHDLLTQSEWGTTPLRAVIEAELGHFNQARDHAVTLNGPSVELAPNDALSFGLAVHELATNAAKYGALSQAGGKVFVSWRLLEPGLAEVEWRELDGPPVEQGKHRGFGTELIQKIVAHELRHPVKLDFNPKGVHCVLSVPVRRRSDFQIRQTGLR